MIGKYAVHRHALNVVDAFGPKCFNAFQDCLPAGNNVVDNHCRSIPEFVDVGQHHFDLAIPEALLFSNHKRMLTKGSNLINPLLAFAVGPYQQ